MILIRRLGVLVSIIVIGLLLVTSLDAQAASSSVTGQSITLSPSSVDTTLQAGKAQTGSLQVVNSGNTGYTFTVSASPYSVSGESYHQVFKPVAGQPDITSWFHFAATSFPAKAGQTVSMSYTITPPADTAPGGYYAAVFAEPVTAPTAQHTGVIIHQRVGTIFYLRVAGTVITKGSVASWQAPFWQSRPLTATLRLTNGGNVHYLSVNHLVVSSVFGGTKYTLTTNREVLPHTTRKIELQWANPPPLALLKVTGTASFLGGTKTLGTHYVLVVAPFVWWILAAVFLAVAAWCAGRYNKHRHRRNRLDRNTNHTPE